MVTLIDELQERWHGMFSALRAGDDVPPSLRLRAEGLMEAVVIVEQASAGDVTLAMDEVYLAVFGERLAQRFGSDWQLFFPFPQIPAMAKRAPVFPSTSD